MRCAEPLHAAADEQSRLLEPRRAHPLARRAGSGRRRDLSRFLRRRRDLRPIASIKLITVHVARDGSHKDNYTPGIAILGKYTFFAEGARGSLSKRSSASSGSMRSSARRNSASASRSYGRFLPRSTGPVSCSTPWVGRSTTRPAGLLHHFGERLVSVGFVVHLDYSNPYINPFKEFQRAKQRIP